MFFSYFSFSLQLWKAIKLMVFLLFLSPFPNCQCIVVYSQLGICTSSFPNTYSYLCQIFLTGKSFVCSTTGSAVLKTDMVHMKTSCSNRDCTRM